MRTLLLLRPEPGLSHSARRAGDLGLAVIACPLFQVEPAAWSPPDPRRYEGLLLTSANAVRHGGAGLERFKPLPVHAVGRATAEAARRAGFRVESIGDAGVEALLAAIPGAPRLLHLTGADRAGPIDLAGIDPVIVYRSIEIERPPLPTLQGLVAAVHSPRAGRRLAELTQERAATRIAAISPAAAEACGTGWEAVRVADIPDDSTLLALAARLCQDSARR